MKPGIRIALSVFASALFSSSGCGRLSRTSLDGPLTRFDEDITSPVTRIRMHPLQTIQLPVIIKNTGPVGWVSGGSAPVVLTYRWFIGDTMLGEGDRTALPMVLRPGLSIALDARITAPQNKGSAVLLLTMVQEGVAWFFTNGGRPLRIPVELGGVADIAMRKFADEIISGTSSLKLKPMQTVTLPVTVKNVSDEPWPNTGIAPVTVSYRWFDGSRMLPIPSKRTALPTAVGPGQAIQIRANIEAPARGHDLVLKITLVQEGVAWFITMGAKTLDIPVTLE